ICARRFGRTMNVTSAPASTSRPPKYPPRPPAPSTSIFMILLSRSRTREHYMDWYFDFISPYSYLQLEQMPRWPEGVVLVAKPILFAALLDHWGQKGPAEIPVKRAFTYSQVQWLGDRAGIPFRFPPRHPFNPVSVLRLAVALDN